MRLVLPSGRSLDANLGIIGIDDELEIYEGYDGPLVEPDEPLSAEDRRYLAEVMIARWRAFAEAADKAAT